MHGKTILISSQNKRGARRLAAGLRGAGNRTLTAPSPQAAAALASARAVDLVLIDCEAWEDAEQALRTLSEDIPVVALSPKGCKLALTQVFGAYQVDHVVCGSETNEDGIEALDCVEIVTAVEKILRKDFFGLDKYISGFGLELLHCVVRRAEERDALIKVIRGYLADIGCGRSMAAKLATLVDELVTNAIYNAPRDLDGRPRHEGTSRREKVRLREGEEILVRFGSDGDRFGVTVTDCFGSLSAKRLRECVVRCLTDDEQIEQKSGGAGLGVYTSLMSCNQLVFNIDPGVRTEVVAIAELGRSKRAQKSRGHSLHVFEAEDRSVSDGVPASVVVSDSTRTDIAQLFNTEPATRARPHQRSKRSSEVTWKHARTRRRQASGSPHPDFLRT